MINGASGTPSFTPLHRANLEETHPEKGNINNDPGLAKTFSASRPGQSMAVHGLDGLDTMGATIRCPDPSIIGVSTCGGDLLACRLHADSSTVFRHRLAQPRSLSCLSFFPSGCSSGCSRECVPVRRKLLPPDGGGVVVHC